MLHPLREFDAKFPSRLANAEDIWRIMTVALACKFFTCELRLGCKKGVPSCALIIAEHVVIVCWSRAATAPVGTALFSLRGNRQREKPRSCSSCIGLSFPFCYALLGKAAYDLDAGHQGFPR